MCVTPVTNIFGMDALLKKMQGMNITTRRQSAAELY